MALLYTYAMLLNKLQEDLDLINEPFVSPDELLGYINEAIEEAETAVHTIGIEDTYFLASDFINLVSGQSSYNLPADIYATKIRKMFYSNPITTVVTTGAPQVNFVVTAANATAGATYSNNGQTFTVLNTIAGGTALQLTGTGNASASGILTKVSGAGDATITFSSWSLSNILVLASGTGIAQGMALFGTGIPNTTKVNSISGVNATISNTPTVTESGVTFTFVSIQPVYGARRYEVRKIRNLQDTLYFYPGDDYKFILQNLQQGAGGMQLQLYPTPTESGPLIQLWYIREMHRLSNSTTDPTNVCELPECTNFVFQHVKWRVAKKRRIAEMVTVEEAALTKQYQLLEETLKEMVPDENNKVQLDLSAYYNQELDLYY